MDYRMEMVVRGLVGVEINAHTGADRAILTALFGSIHTTGCVLTFSCERGQIFRLDVVSHV